MSKRPIVKHAPAIIAQRAGLVMQQQQSEFGAIYAIQDAAGVARYRSNKRESASAWLEGYAAGWASSYLAVNPKFDLPE